MASLALRMVLILCVAVVITSAFPADSPLQRKTVPRSPPPARASKDLEGSESYWGGYGWGGYGGWGGWGWGGYGGWGWGGYGGWGYGGWGYGGWGYPYWGYGGYYYPWGGWWW